MLKLADSPSAFLAMHAKSIESYFVSVGFARVVTPPLVEPPAFPLGFLGLDSSSLAGALRLWPDFGSESYKHLNVEIF